MKAKEQHHENPCASRNGVEPGQMHRLPYLLRDMQERVDLARWGGVRVVQQRGDQTGHWLSEGMAEPEEVARRLDPRREWQAASASGRQAEGPREPVREPEPASYRRLLRAFHVRLRASAKGAPVRDDADRKAGVRHHGQEDGKDRMGPELGR